MKAFCLVLLLASSALSAPQGDAAEAKKPQARQVYAQAEPVFVQSAPQFGAKIVPENAQVVYLQGGYQQPQYYTSGQQFAYISGAPAQQNFVSGAPAYYTTTSAAQPIVSVKKTVVKPAVYQQVNAVAPQVAYAPYKTQSAQVAYNPAVVSTYKAPVPVKVSAAPAPAPFKVSSAPAVNQYHPEPFHAIVKQAQDDNFDGSFAYSYETDHGINVQSSGFLKNAGTEDEVQVIQGSYSYYSPEGLPITTYYIADENGFQVQGDHLPVAPPLPEAIAKSLEYQRSLPPSAEDQKSQ